MLDSLPEPTFESCKTVYDLLYEVISEMRQTNYLDDYFDRTDRTAKIIDLWGKRSGEIFQEEIGRWNT